MLVVKPLKFQLYNCISNHGAIRFKMPTFTFCCNLKASSQVCVEGGVRGLGEERGAKQVLLLPPTADKNFLLGF